jgi:hypothetical protein
MTHGRVPRTPAGRRHPPTNAVGQHPSDDNEAPKAPALAGLPHALVRTWECCILPVVLIIVIGGHAGHPPLSHIGGRVGDKSPPEQARETTWFASTTRSALTWLAQWARPAR